MRDRTWKIAARAPAFPPEIAFLDALVRIWSMVGTVDGGARVEVADWRVVEEVKAEEVASFVSSISVTAASASVGVIITTLVRSNAAALLWKNALRHE